MVIGVPKEILNNENRVSITPGGTHSLVRAGCSVHIESLAGYGSGFSDTDYKNAGAKIFNNTKELYDSSDIIVKVKEPLQPEFNLFKDEQLLFTYLHLAPNRQLTEFLLGKKITAIAYETVQTEDGSLPLLTPMSEVAGRMSAQIGAGLLQKYNGGSGILLGGVPGVHPAEVLIIGGGVVGTNAAKIAVGMGARVSVMDINPARLSYLDDIFSGRITTLFYNEYTLSKMIQNVDLLIGAVLVTGAKAPKVVSETMVKTMKRGAVIVDVAIDQGGSIETIDRITTHDNPYYEKYGVIHYSVANMPGAVPRTSTFALTGATLPYIIKIATSGLKNALQEDKSLRAGLNTYRGKITCKAVAQAVNMDYIPAELLLT